MVYKRRKEPKQISNNRCVFDHVALVGTNSNDQSYQINGDNSRHFPDYLALHQSDQLKVLLVMYKMLEKLLKREETKANRFRRN